MLTITRQERLGTAAAAVVAWSPVAAFWIYSKWIRIHYKYFPLLSDYSGIGDGARWFDHLAVVRQDILISCVLLPCLIFGSHFLWPRHGGVRFFWASLSLLLIALLFANLHSWGTVGQFLSGSAALAAVSFALEQPAIIESYLGWRSVLKLGALVLAVVLLSFAARRLWKFRTLVMAMCAGVAAGLLAAVVLWASTNRSALASLPVTRDFVVQAVEAFIGSETESQKAARKGLASGSSSSDPDAAGPAVLVSDYFGKASETDLLIFVLETGARAFVDLDQDLRSFPSLAKLSSHSLVALNHFSTFPATAEAMFSLYTGVYPARSLYKTCIVDSARNVGTPLHGIIASLASRGYFTAAYLPYTSVVPLDKSLYGKVGFKKVFYSQAHGAPAGVKSDRRALEEMLGDIERLAKADKRFAAVFLPQVGHAPWGDRPRDSSVKSHGKLVAGRQDAWLGEVIQLLESLGRLESTTIVVTGDHGIRTTAEDPDFRSGFIDEYSFAVPLLIHSRPAFPKKAELRELTSHIDLSPTLRELYGFAPDPREQGVHFWSPVIGQRRVYMLANWYFGADGYTDESGWNMHSDVLGLSFRSERPMFNFKNVIRESAVGGDVERAISSFYQAQQVMIESQICQ